MSSNYNLISLLKAHGRKLLSIACSLILFMFAWAKPSISLDRVARAESIDNLPFVVAIEGISDQVEGKVEKDIGTVQRNLGKISGQTEGALQQAQGSAEEAVGKAQRNIGEVTGQTEGALKQAKGSVKQGIGEAKNQLDNAGDNVEDASEGFLNSVKDFFD